MKDIESAIQNICSEFILYVSLRFYFRSDIKSKSK